MAKKEPEVIKIPDQIDFANNLAISFFEEEGVMLDIAEDQTPLDAIIQIPEIHADFTIWLCDLLRESAYGDLTIPPNTMLN